MTREERAEAKNIMSQMIKDEEGFLSDDTVEAHKIAIKALEQEPILDKIRAEIKALSNANPSYWHSGDMVDRDDVLDIIDKYREGDSRNERL